MSDVLHDAFGDDFTIELRKYYLQSLMTELQKFVDLIDESTWKKIRTEVQEASIAWSLDGKTNEFEFLSEWFVKLSQLMPNATQSSHLLAWLETAKKYVVHLLTNMVDSIDVANKYPLCGTLEASQAYLHCKYLENDFVIPVKNVVEVVPLLQIHSLPEEIQGVLGVVAYRGEAIPVFSRWEAMTKEASHSDLLNVICELDGFLFSLQATFADELIQIKNEELQPTSASPLLKDVGFVKSFFIKDSQRVMVIDIEMLVAA